MLGCVRCYVRLHALLYLDCMHYYIRLRALLYLGCVPYSVASKVQILVKSLNQTCRMPGHLGINAQAGITVRSLAGRFLLNLLPKGVGVVIK